MSEKIVWRNEEVIRGQRKELMRGSVEETRNEPLEAAVESAPIAGLIHSSRSLQTNLYKIFWRYPIGWTAL